MTFKTVAVVGASGSLGTPLVQALLAAGFKVTAISRESSTATFPTGVEVRKADLGSVESLTKAFAGQDVVVVTTTTSEANAQTPLIDAAVAAGVKRFIPSEWGFDTRPGFISGPFADFVAGKTKTLEYLVEQTKKHPGLTWTGIATDAFLDWGFDHGVFGINLAAKTANIFDSGDVPVTSTTLLFIAQSVVAVLQQPEQETANKYLHVFEHTVTQNELLKLFEEETGAKFAVTRVSTADLAKVRDEKKAKGDPSGFYETLLVTVFGGRGRPSKEEETDNVKLGLKKRELRQVVSDYIKARSS